MKDEFHQPCAQSTFLQKKPFAVSKENNHLKKNVLFSRRKRKQLEQQDCFYNNQNHLENIGKPSRKTFKKAKHSCRKFNTEPFCQNQSANGFIISDTRKPQNEDLKVNFRKFNSEPFQLFNNLDSSVNVVNSNEFSFLTPNINKSTTISNDTVEEINLADPTEDEINSTVSFGKFKPKLSSTQLISKTDLLDVSKNSIQNSKFNSNVVDETPNRDLENFFVPSLALPSQKPMSTTNKNEFGLNQSREEEKHKCGSILEISLDAAKKCKPFGKGTSSHCKSHNSQQMEADFIFSEVVAKKGLKHDNVANEWIKRIGHFGNAFYIHKRTGK